MSELETSLSSASVATRGGICWHAGWWAGIESLHHHHQILTEPHVLQPAMAAVKCGFKKKLSYPQIRSAILSPSVYPLLAVCPNLESLTTFEESAFLLTFIKGLPALQKLSSRSPFTAAGSFSAILFGAGFNTPTAIAEELPSLQQISLSLEDIDKSLNSAAGKVGWHCIRTYGLWKSAGNVFLNP